MMYPVGPVFLARVIIEDIAGIRLIAMFVVLLIGLSLGYFARHSFGVSESWAKTIMTASLASFNWLITLFVIWQMTLSRQLIWLPIIGLILMLAITVLSSFLFSFSNLDNKSRLTLILAGGLSNLGYTGGAFVCYAFFGTQALALANIYPAFWEPFVYLVFFPLFRMYELRENGTRVKFSLSNMLDVRFMGIPAVIAAVILNITTDGPPAFVNRIHLIDIFIYTASALAFFAIGLGIKLSNLKNYISLFFSLSAVKFILTPIVALLIVWLLTLTGINLSGLVQKTIIVQSLTPSAVMMVTMSNVFSLNRCWQALFG